MYLRNELERPEKNAFSIISPSLTYYDALTEANIPTIISYSEAISMNFFNSIVNKQDNKLNKLLPTTNEVSYELRQNRYFIIPNWSTNRFRNTFIMSSTIKNG